MKNLLPHVVIADDITGAAEIAGIAFDSGLQVRLQCAGSASASVGSVRASAGQVCGCFAATNVDAGAITVIATDTRSMSEGEAAEETLRIASLLPPPSTITPSSSTTASPSSLSAAPSPSLLLFKKTDSALRGHVVAELTALMERTGYCRAVYLPANPSKGRIIRGGIYYIKVKDAEDQMTEKPIAETDFSFDPEFPARTSALRERFPDAEEKGIIMPDAESMDDIRRIVDAYNDGSTLFAGAADLFKVLCDITQHPTPITQHPSTLILCGSTQSRQLDLGIPVAPMPREVYDGGSDLAVWDTAQYSAHHSLILSIPYTHRTGKETAVHLRGMMARKAQELISIHRPGHLVIEGGATAWTTLQLLGWTQFSITRQVAPGVVQMSATNGTLVTLKPGSYPWGNLF